MTSDTRPPTDTPARVFSLDDQRDFARLSGDRNPMHLDALYARRTQAGECVVHGIHTLLWGLECLAAAGVDLTALKSLRVSFSRFIYLDRAVTFEWQQTAASVVKAQIKLGTAVAVAMTLKFGARAPQSAEGWTDLPAVDFADGPLTPSSAAIETFAGWLEPTREAGGLASAFPRTCESLGLKRLESIALLSTLVGMVCPGMHSIFTDFSLTVTEAGTDRPGLGIKTSHSRLRLVAMDVFGPGLDGEVNAIERFAPVETQFADIASRVTPGEFRDKNALIVGGSRGLGAATAKLIAAGGGHVTITYARGAQEAAAIQTEINTALGEARCAIAHLDVTEGRLDGGKTFDSLYYFATPRIFRQVQAVFDPDLFRVFLDVYVGGFARLLEDLGAGKDKRAMHIMYPSSIAVNDRPANMTEYAMAKAAGEILCEDLARSSKALRFAVPRLPRILTDQTATVPVVEAADPVVTMLDLLRAETSGRGA